MRRPRAFPHCAKVNPTLTARVAVRPGVEMLPDPTVRAYAPVGLYADGSKLV